MPEEQKRLYARPVPDKFWETKTLQEMSHEEWESLCDGCGKCCLIKFEHDDYIETTNMVCSLFNIKKGLCGDYKNRSKKVPECVTLSAGNISELDWMPDTCAYRLLSRGEKLKWWHPLVSGSRDTVHQSNNSVKGKVRYEPSQPFLEE